jgi:hypothetical protein
MGKRRVDTGAPGSAPHAAPRERGAVDSAEFSSKLFIAHGAWYTGLRHLLTKKHTFWPLPIWIGCL